MTRSRSRRPIRASKTRTVLRQLEARRTTLNVFWRVLVAAPTNSRHNLGHVQYFAESMRLLASGPISKAEGAGRYDYRG